MKIKRVVRITAEILLLFVLGIPASFACTSVIWFALNEHLVLASATVPVAIVLILKWLKIHKNATDKDDGIFREESNQ